MAPEVFKQRRKRRQASVDIWALAIITTELFNEGEKCFVDAAEISMMMANQSLPEGVANLSDKLRALVTKALSHDPLLRPSAEEFRKAIGELYNGTLYIRVTPF